MIVRVLEFPLKGGLAIRTSYEILPQATTLEQAKYIINPQQGMVVLINVKTGECLSILGSKDLTLSIGKSDPGKPSFSIKEHAHEIC